MHSQDNSEVGGDSDLIRYFSGRLFLLLDSAAWSNTISTPLFPPTGSSRRCLSPSLAYAILKKDVSHLDKPSKPQSLLSKSLTGISGEAWKRQRPIIERAFGGGIALQRRRHFEANKATEKAVKDTSRGRVELRSWAALVASRAMALAIVGAQVPRAVREDLEAAMVDAFDETLRARAPGRANVRLNALGRPVKRGHGGLGVAINAAVNATRSLSNGPEPTSLIQRLLLFEGDALGDEEVEANIASAVYAGFQAASLLLLTSVLELAGRPNVQERLAREAGELCEEKLGCGGVVQAVMRETLRIYPPVLGLPRVCKRPLSVDGGDGKGNKREMLRKGELVVVDLVALAHGRHQVGNTFEWDLDGTPTKAGACPFGVGPRSCPAGSLTLVLVGRALHALASEVTIELIEADDSWSLWTKRVLERVWSKVRHPKDKHPYWRRYLEHRPTLICRRSVFVKFRAREGGREGVEDGNRNWNFLKRLYKRRERRRSDDSAQNKV